LRHFRVVRTSLACSMPEACVPAKTIPVRLPAPLVQLRQSSPPHLATRWVRHGPARQSSAPRDRRLPESRVRHGLWTSATRRCDATLLHQGASTNRDSPCGDTFLSSSGLHIESLCARARGKALSKPPTPTPPLQSLPVDSLPCQDTFQTLA